MCITLHLRIWLNFYTIVPTRCDDMSIVWISQSALWRYVDCLDQPIRKSVKFDHVLEFLFFRTSWPCKSLRARINLCCDYCLWAYWAWFLHSGTRADNMNLLLVPKVKKSTFDGRSFSFTASFLWNQLPNHLRHASSLEIFLTNLKTHLSTKI